MNGSCRFKNFYGLSVIPTELPEKLSDRTLNYQTPVWLDDIIIVTKGDKKPGNIFFTKLKELQEDGYRASEKKSKFFLEETTLLELKITEHGIKPNKEKMKMILQLKPPASSKALKLFLSAIQFVAKISPKLSKQKTTE